MKPERGFFSKTVGGRDAGIERQGRQVVCVFLKGMPDRAFNAYFKKDKTLRKHHGFILLTTLIISALIQCVLLDTIYISHTSQVWQQQWTI